MADDREQHQRIVLTTAIVGAFVGNHTVARSDLPALIRSVHDALSAATSPEGTSDAAATAKPTTAQIRKSIRPDGLVSFEDGKTYKTLKRHLHTQGLTMEEYRAKWGLPSDYPSVAASYSQARSALAKALGLGQGGRRPKGKAKKAWNSVTQLVSERQVAGCP